MLQAVNAAALMERTPFAIDDAKDDDEKDEDGDDFGEEDHDDQVMDEVISSCVKALADVRLLTTLSHRLTRSWRRTILG